MGLTINRLNVYIGAVVYIYVVRVKMIILSEKVKYLQIPGLIS